MTMELKPDRGILIINKIVIFGLISIIVLLKTDREKKRWRNVSQYLMSHVKKMKRKSYENAQILVRTSQIIIIIHINMYLICNPGQVFDVIFASPPEVLTDLHTPDLIHPIRKLFRRIKFSLQFRKIDNTYLNNQPDSAHIPKFLILLLRTNPNQFKCQAESVTGTEKRKKKCN